MSFLCIQWEKVDLQKLSASLSDTARVQPQVYLLLSINNGIRVGELPTSNFGEYDAPVELPCGSVVCYICSKKQAQFDCIEQSVSPRAGSVLQGPDGSRTI